MNGDGAISARDALAIVVRAVGYPASLTCSCDACEIPGTTTTTSTTTTMPCATDLTLDDRVFNRKSICCSFGFPTFKKDTITFNRLSGNDYEVLGEGGVRLHLGTLDCTKFKVRGSLGYWTFDGEDAFSGNSGRCNDTGTAVPAEPPYPRPPRCPQIMTHEIPR